MSARIPIGQRSPPSSTLKIACRSHGAGATARLQARMGSSSAAPQASFIDGSKRSCVSDNCRSKPLGKNA